MMVTCLANGSAPQRDKHTEGTLDPARERRLLDLPGWTWDPYADRWEEGFRRLQDYVKRHGDANVPQKYVVDGYRLGTWVNTQRRNHFNGTLAHSRQRRLAYIPGWSRRSPRPMPGSRYRCITETFTGFPAVPLFRRPRRRLDNVWCGVPLRRSADAGQGERDVLKSV